MPSLRGDSSRFAQRKRSPGNEERPRLGASWDCDVMRNTQHRGNQVLIVETGRLCVAPGSPGARCPAFQRKRQSGERCPKMANRPIADNRVQRSAASLGRWSARRVFGRTATRRASSTGGHGAPRLRGSRCPHRNLMSTVRSFWLCLGIVCVACSGLQARRS